MGGRIKDFSYFKLSFCFDFHWNSTIVTEPDVVDFGEGFVFSVSHWNRKEDETKNKNKTWIPFLFFTTSPTLLFCLVPPPPLWLCMELMMMQHFIHDKNGGKEEEKVKLCVKCASRSSLVSIFYWLIKYYYLCLSVGHRSDMLSSVDSIREKKIY